MREVMECERGKDGKDKAKRKRGKGELNGEK